MSRLFSLPKALRFSLRASIPRSTCEPPLLPPKSSALLFASLYPSLDMCVSFPPKAQRFSPGPSCLCHRRAPGLNKSLSRCPPFGFSVRLSSTAGSSTADSSTADSSNADSSIADLAGTTSATPRSCWTRTTRQAFFSSFLLRPALVPLGSPCSDFHAGAGQGPGRLLLLLFLLPTLVPLGSPRGDSPDSSFEPKKTLATDCGPPPPKQNKAQLRQSDPAGLWDAPGPSRYVFVRPQVGPRCCNGGLKAYVLPACKV